MRTRERGLGTIGIVASISGALVALLVLGTILSFALGWFNAGVHVFSVENVQQQYSDAYTRFNALKADACNVKQERALVAGSTDPSIQVQYQQQETAYEQLFRSTQATYQSAVDNAFAAKHVLPGDLPRIAPDLESVIASSCP